MARVSVKFRVKEFPKISELVLKDVRKTKDFYYDTVGYDFLKSGTTLVNLNSNIANRNYIEFFMSLTSVQSKLIKGTRFFYRNFKNKTNEVEKIFKVLKIPFNGRYVDFNSFLKANNLKVVVGLGKKVSEYEVSKNETLYLKEVEDIKKFVEIESVIPDGEDIEAEKQRLIEKVKSLNILAPTDEYVTGDYLDIYLKQFNVVAYNQRKRF